MNKNNYVHLVYRKPKHTLPVITEDEKMSLFGFDNFDQFSAQLDTDLSFRHFVFDYLKECL